MPELQTCMALENVCPDIVSVPKMGKDVMLGNRLLRALSGRDYQHVAIATSIQETSLLLYLDKSTSLSMPSYTESLMKLSLRYKIS